MGPLFFFLGLAVIGIGVAGWVNGVQRKHAAEAADKVRQVSEDRSNETDPFADVAKEQAPVRTASGQMLDSAFAGTGGLFSHPTWVKALELAAVADALTVEAKAAKKKNDHALFNTKGKAAKEKYDEALELTAQWEIDITAKHGENHAEVRRITRQRNKWFDMLAIFSKTTSR
jgi:hypothetical protein